MSKNKVVTVAPVHPGEILREDFLEPMGISNYRLAKATNMPASRIGAIVNGQRAVTVDTAMRLARALGTTPGFWMNIQSRYDLEMARDNEAEILKDVEVLAHQEEEVA